MVSLEFFILTIYGDSVPEIFPEGWRRPVRTADNLTTLMCLEILPGTILVSIKTEGKGAWRSEAINPHILKPGKKSSHMNLAEHFVEERSLLPLSRTELLHLGPAVFTHLLCCVLNSMNYVKSLRMRWENKSRPSGRHLYTTVTNTHVFIWKMTLAVRINTCTVELGV